MFGYRNICLSIASTAYAALSLSSHKGTHAFAFVTKSTLTVNSSTRIQGGKLLSWRTALRASSSSSSDHKEEPAQDGGINTSPFPRLYGNTLVSIQQCIDAFNQEQRQPQEEESTSKRLPKIIHVDGSWYHRPDPTTGLMRNPSQEYISGPRLPGSRFLDIDALATSYELFPDENPKGLPHMMPPPKLFGLAMDAYNIRNEDHIIIHARRGALFTPRVWFLFLSMGHDPSRLHLMEGSLEDYMEKGGSIVETNLSLMDEDERQHEADEHYATMGKAYLDCFDQGILNITQLYHSHYASTSPQYTTEVTSAMHICDKEEVLEAVNYHLEQQKNEDSTTTEEFTKTVIIDTRGSGYAKKGHMPSAIHLPYTQIATPNNSLMFQPKSTLKKLFEERGIDYLDPELKIILSCGSGVSVCHGYLALKELGRDITEDNTRIYDGSWAEWGKEYNLPKVLPNEID